MTTTFDHCKSISISDFARHGYLRPGQTKSGTLTWRLNGISVGSILATSNLISSKPFLELRYICDDKPIQYKIQLVSSPSNIGKGVVWYFICPLTGKQCRKLYAIGDTFLHRDAYSGCMYATQTKSRKQRNRKRLRDMAFGSHKDEPQIGSRYFKSTYAGKATKRFQKRTDEIQSSMRMLSQLRDNFLV